MTSPHPLQGAFDRVNRAREHIAALEVEQEAFGKAYHDNLTIELQPHGDGHRFGQREIEKIVPCSIVAILLGEIVYNLRAAMDYLVYELAWKDSTTPQDGTQFPICDLEEDFKRVAPKFLRGLDSSHVALMESLQPYMGGYWFATLRDFSNPDKHRRLRYSGYGFRTRITTMPVKVPEGPFAPGVRSKRRAIGESGEEMDVYLFTEAPIMIAARGADGSTSNLPVVELLKEIQACVRSTLELFKSDF